MSVDIKRITIRMPPELHRQLHQVADAQSVSLNTLAIRALEASRPLRQIRSAYPYANSARSWPLLPRQPS